MFLVEATTNVPRRFAPDHVGEVMRQFLLTLWNTYAFFVTYANLDGWQPPLLLLTTKPAKAVNTQVVARAFCLNGFQFVAGDSFGCWDVPMFRFVGPPTGR